MKNIISILFSIIFLAFYSCSEKTEVIEPKAETSITVEVLSTDHINFHGNQYTFSEFHKIAEKQIKELENKGATRDQIFVNLKAAPKVKMGFIADIQLILKNMNLRKIRFTES